MRYIILMAILGGLANFAILCLYDAGYRVTGGAVLGVCLALAYWIGLAATTSRLTQKELRK